MNSFIRILIFSICLLLFADQSIACSRINGEEEEEMVLRPDENIIFIGTLTKMEKTVDQQNRHCLELNFVPEKIYYGEETEAVGYKSCFPEYGEFMEEMMGLHEGADVLVVLELNKPDPSGYDKYYTSKMRPAQGICTPAIYSKKVFFEDGIEKAEEEIQMFIDTHSIN